MKRFDLKSAAGWTLGVLGWVLFAAACVWWALSNGTDLKFDDQVERGESAITYATFSVEGVKQARGQLYGREIAITGRVYCDEGKWHWIVSDGEMDPLSGYAIKLSAWPFENAPGPGMLTREFRLVGHLEEGTSDTFDILIGPFSIEQRWE